MANRLPGILAMGILWLLFGLRMFVVGVGGGWWGCWLLVGFIVLLADPTVYRNTQALNKDGWFGIHPSLRAMWRKGYDEDGKRLDGTVETIEMWWFGA